MEKYILKKQTILFKKQANGDTIVNIGNEDILGTIEATNDMELEKALDKHFKSLEKMGRVSHQGLITTFIPNGDSSTCYHYILEKIKQKSNM